MDWLYAISLMIVLAVMVSSQDSSKLDVIKSTGPQECGEGYSCVKYFLCNNNNVLTNGSGLLSPRQEERAGRSCNGDRLSRCCRNPQTIQDRTNAQECGAGYTCVKYYLCANEGAILTNGSGLLIARDEDGKSCNGDIFSKCCRNPETPKIQKRIGCSPTESCVPYYLCDDENGIIKNGKRLLDARSDDSPCESYLDVCCSHESKRKPDIETKLANRGCGWRNKDGLYFENRDGKPNQTKFTEFPWTMAILEETRPMNTVTDAYKCGGSLIHPSVVLTAAHCLDNIAGELKVRAGEWDIQTFREPLMQQDLKVSEIIVHKRYDRPTLQNDIAILIVKGSFEITDNVQPICLPPKDTAFDGQNCYVTGWGQNAYTNDDQYQTIMKKLQLPIIPRKKCQDLFRQTRLGPFYELHSSVICAGGEEGNSACIGDGGSPLVCPIPGFDERYYQAGVVSWGLECGIKDVPDGYVSISEMRPWIDQELSARKIDISYFTSIS